MQGEQGAGISGTPEVINFSGMVVNLSKTSLMLSHMVTPGSTDHVPTVRLPCTCYASFSLLHQLFLAARFLAVAGAWKRGWLCPREVQGVGEAAL